MTYKYGDKKYQRLNIFTREYIDAVNSNAPAEELHQHLRSVIAEAIRTEISLEHLLRVLSGSSLEESDTEMFIDHVSRHYAYGVTAARVKEDTKTALNKKQ